MKIKIVVAKIIKFCFKYHFFLVTIFTSFLYLIRELYSLICDNIRLTQVIYLLFIITLSGISLAFSKKNEKEIYLLVSQISIIFLFAEYFIYNEANQHGLFFFCQILYQRLCIQWGKVRQKIVLFMSLLTLIYILIRINFNNDNWDELGIMISTKYIIINFFTLVIPLGMEQVLNSSNTIDNSLRKLNQDLQQLSNNKGNDGGKQSPTLNQVERKKSDLEDKDGKNAKIQYLSNFIQQDMTFLHDKYLIANKYTMNKSPTLQYNQQRYQQQFLEGSSTTDVHYQMNQNTQASMFFNHQENKKQTKILNLIEEVSDYFSLGIALFNTKKDLIYYNQTIQQEFLNGCSSKTNIKQGILQYSLDIKNISQLAQKYSNQKDRNRSRANSRVENQLNRSQSLGGTVTGTLHQSSFINGFGFNSHMSDSEDNQLNEIKEQKKRTYFEQDEKNQNRLQFRSEQTNDFSDLSKSEINLLQDSDCKNLMKNNQQQNRNIYVKANYLAKVNVSKNHKMIEKLNSGLCTLGELINLCLQYSNYEFEYMNKSVQHIQIDKINQSHRKEKSEEEIYSQLESHLNEDEPRKRARTKINYMDQYDSNGCIEQKLSSTIDYQIKSNQIIITTKNNQKEKVIIKVKVFYAKVDDQNENLDESIFTFTSSSNLIAVIEFVKQSLFGKQNIGYENTKEEINEYKKRILSSLSHELKTPLNCSIQLLDILLQNDKIPEKQKKMFVQPSLNSNQLLLVMINDILDFAQIEKGELCLQFKMFNLIDLLRECVSYFMISATTKDIKFELNFDNSIPDLIHTDEMRLKQVVINLISNAIKFTSRGKISVYADNLISQNSDSSQNDIIRISISDTGCGIEQQNIKSIFKGLQYNKEGDLASSQTLQNSEHFSRKQTTFQQSKFNNQKKLNTEGAGLGLTIANNIAKGLGGNRKIEVTSQIGKGSTFSFFVVNRSIKTKGCEINNYKFLNQSYSQWKSFQSNSVTKDLSEQISHSQNGEQSKFDVPESNKVSLSMTTIIDEFVKNNVSNQDLNVLDDKLHRDVMQISVKSSPTKSSKMRNHLASSFASNQKSYSNRVIELSPNQSAHCIQEDSCDLRSDMTSSKKFSMPNNPIIPFFILQGSNMDFMNSYFQNSPAHKQYWENMICGPEPPTSHFENSPSKRLSVSSTLIRIKDPETQKLQNNIIQFLNSSRQSKANINPIHLRQLNLLKDDLNTHSSIDTPLASNSSQISNNHALINKSESTVSSHKIKKQLNKSNFQQSTTSLIQINNGSNKKGQQNLDSATNIDIGAPSINFIVNKTMNNNELKNNIEIHLSPSSKNIKTLLIEKNQSQICHCSQILIVDDNDFNLYALELKLKVYDFNVDKATSGIGAISMVQDKYENSSCCQKYALIFMDIDMPIKNGYETTKDIRQYFHSQNTNPTIISACTAYIQESQQRQAKESGMKYYITKPINTEKLEEVLFKVFLQKYQYHKK